MASLKEMVEQYNNLTGKKIKKFASRAAAEKQLAKAQAQGSTVEAGAATGETAAANKPVIKERTVVGTRSKIVKKTWKDEKIAAARAMRHPVTVVGEGDFKSVAAAFRKLKLPMGTHVAFRGEVVREGKATFEHGEHKYTFKLAKTA